MKHILLPVGPIKQRQTKLWRTVDDTGDCQQRLELVQRMMSDINSGAYNMLLLLL